MKRKKLKINNRMFFVCFFKNLIIEYRNISDLYRKKGKESMLNIIKSRKRKLNHGQHIYWHDTFNWEERDTRKKMLNFAKKNEEICLFSKHWSHYLVLKYLFFLFNPLWWQNKLYEQTRNKRGNRLCR